jgi:hypothetical protein
VGRVSAEERKTRRKDVPSNGESGKSLRTREEAGEDERRVGSRRILEEVVGPNALHGVSLTFSDTGCRVRVGLAAENGREVRLALVRVGDDTVDKAVEPVALGDDEGADRVVVSAGEEVGRSGVVDEGVDADCLRVQLLPSLAV